MQNVYYIDSNFIKENSTQYSLSIRFSTDGFSFCVHDEAHKLLAFHFQPFQCTHQDETIEKVKKVITEDTLLNLKYRKVFVLPCRKEKILLPAESFNKNNLADLYKVCLSPQKNDTLLYRKIKLMDSYLVEALPRNFVVFLTARFPAVCIVNHAYPFIIHSLSNILFNTDHLFMDIHDQYFDLLLTRSSEVLLFNSFSYGSVNDIIYYALNCLQQCNVGQENLQTTISGNLIHDPVLVDMLNQFIANIAILNYAPLSQLVKNPQLNNSSFIHLLNIHKCE